MAAYHMFPLVGPMTRTNRSKELKWAMAFIDFPHFKRPYMGWVSWSLLGSILFGILGTYIWLDQLGRVPFNYRLPNASELTWQFIRLYQDLECIMPHDQSSSVGGAYAKRRGCDPTCRELTSDDGVNRGRIRRAAAAF
jgi:hypothetical protein